MSGGGVQPWGRFKLVSKEPAEESDHLYFSKRVNKIGRNNRSADVVIDRPFISGVHCIVTLEGRMPNGNPIVRLKDMSRNGMYVNEECVDKTSLVELQPNATVHFTKPGLSNVEPVVFRFEVLRDGLSVENERRRIEAEATSIPRMATTNTPSRATPTLEQLTGKKKKRGEEEEIEIEVTRSISGGATDSSPSSSSAKRRRVAAGGDDDTSLSTRLKIANDDLREKLRLASESVLELKPQLTLREREVVTLTGQLQDLEENKRLMESELAIKSERLTDREQEVERYRQERETMQQTMEELQIEVSRVTAEASRHAEAAGYEATQRQKVETDMVTMTAQYKACLDKNRALEEDLKKIRANNSKLLSNMDSVQIRTNQAEEVKEGVKEENEMLHTRMVGILTVMKSFEAMASKITKLATWQDVHAIMGPELQALQQLDHSFPSSELSQPPLTQDHFFPETQQEDDDHEETQDAEALAIRGSTTTSGVGPFAGFTSKVPLLTSMSSDLLNLSDQQQPLSTDISQDETPSGYSDVKSSEENSGLSSQSSSSKTPPAPPPPRQKLTAESRAQVARGTEETKREGPSQSSDDGANDAEQKKDSSRSDESADDDEDEKNKENTPVKAESAASVDARASTQKQPWLQMDANDDDKSDQAASESGIFDDETQLSSE